VGVEDPDRSDEPGGLPLPEVFGAFGIRSELRMGVRVDDTQGGLRRWRRDREAWGRGREKHGGKEAARSHEEMLANLRSPAPVGLWPAHRISLFGQLPEQSIIF